MDSTVFHAQETANRAMPLAALSALHPLTRMDMAVSTLATEPAYLVLPTVLVATLQPAFPALNSIIS